jgi:hypothetical protein
VSAEDREIIKKIKEYAKENGKKILDRDLWGIKGLSQSKYYVKLRDDESFIDFEWLEHMHIVLSRDESEANHVYLKDYIKKVLLPELKDEKVNKLNQYYQNKIDCLSFITTVSPILFISMYSIQISENIEDILNSSTQQNTKVKELNICVNEEGSDYENRDVIIQKIRKWRENNDYVGDVFIRMIFREYNVPSTVTGIVEGRVISYVQDGEQFLRLSDIGQRLIVDDVIQIMSPKFSEYLLSGSQDALDYDDVNNVDNSAVKLVDF